MESKTDHKPKIDLAKYDPHYKGALVIGLCKDGWTIYSKECEGHEHFFKLLNEVYDEEGVVDVRVELNNPFNDGGNQ